MRTTRIRPRAPRHVSVAAAVAATALATLLGGLPAAATPTATPTAAPTAAPTADCPPWGCADSQPRLSVPVPAPAAPGAHATEDFDSDGVPNSRDNCLLVPNSGQEGAVRPAGAAVDPLAAEWDSANPRAAFRTNAELGEACSGWNENWRRTEKAQMLAPEALKHKLFAFLGAGGPMIGPDTLVYGGPVCSDLNAGFIAMGEYFFGFPRTPVPMPPQAACPDGEWAEQGQDFVAAHIWAGKRLFTPTNAGGQITNRFFPGFSEAPGADQFAQAAGEQWFPRGRAQTVLGHVLRGASYTDGREAILLDWRAVSGSNAGGYPIANGGLPGFGDYLVYDECRGLQEGIWTCSANADIVKPDGQRELFQFAWMMWQSLDPDVARWEAWERANPEWTAPEAYGF